ncbi:MAG: NB-ARC domain-containing protein [Snowella sp.]|nr:NB-ARC domain-containing protein [Snowella sp.]
MNVNEVLQFMDRLVLERTGKHLDDVQRAVIEGTWQKQTYRDMAQEFKFNKNYVGDVGAGLWQLLSEVLGEEVKKTNFRSTLERLGLSDSPIIIQSHNTNNSNSFNICTKANQDNCVQKNNKNQSYYDLTFSPQIVNFYNRQTELETLSNWIISQNIRLISVLGLNGIGKTTLVKKFVDLNLENFEIIIWKNLKFPKPLESLFDEILTTCQQEPQANTSDKLKQISALLTQKKSLITLDDVQNLFISGELAGQYQTQYFDYQNWFKTLTESQHQGSVVLISQEQCPEMHCLDEELYPIKCLELSGLDSTEILEHRKLKDQDSWSSLIDLYHGNPQYLQEIATLIKDFFDDSVADFLAEEVLILSNKMRSQFKLLFERLSKVEKEMVLALSQLGKPTSREDLKESLDLPSTELINALQSLQKRSLVNRKKEDKTLFYLCPLFAAYLTNLANNH